MTGGYLFCPHNISSCTIHRITKRKTLLRVMLKVKHALQCLALSVLKVINYIFVSM